MAKKAQYQKSLSTNYPEHIYNWIKETSDKLEKGYGEFVREIVMDYYDKNKDNE